MERKDVSTRAHHRGPADMETERQLAIVAHCALDPQRQKKRGGSLLAGLSGSGFQGGSALAQWEQGEKCVSGPHETLWATF